MSTFDISDTLAPKSDQLDAVDLLGSPPRIFTVESVSRGNSEQPVQVHLKEFPRVWRPGKSMRRVLAHLWGAEASQWVGRRVELYCDENVVFGSEKVGGTRISRMSHIDGPKSVPIIIKKGRSGGYKVEPLPDAPSAPPTDPATPAQIAAETDTAVLRGWWQSSSPEHRNLIESRVAELTEPTDQPAIGADA